MTADDKAGKPRKTKDRLAAMQAKHAAPDVAPDPGPDPARDPVPAAASEGGGGQGGALAGLMRDLQAAMAGGQGGRAAIMQRLRQALSGPDGRIDPQRARMALMFVRKQASDPAAPRHELAKRVEEFVRNMQPQQRQRLMAAAGMGGGIGGGMGGGAAAGGGQGRPGRGKAGWAGGGQAGGGQAGPGGRAQAPAAGEDGQKGEAWFDNFLDKP